MQATDEGACSLMDAVERGDVERVRELLRGEPSDASGVRFAGDSGVDVNSVNGDGETALLCALKQGDGDVVRLLIERGADVNAVDTDGLTVLMHASMRDKRDIARSLIDRGAAVNAFDSDGKTALLYAAMWGAINTVRLLVERGADVNASDSDGKTALMHASMWGEIGFVQFLVERGADVHAVDRNGNTALMNASDEGTIEVVRFLIAQGVDVNAAESDGKTALMYASERGKVDDVRLLIDRGADVNSVNKNGKTAAFFAASSGESDIQRLLIPLLQIAQHPTGMSQDTPREPRSSSSTSWLISPFEIELQSVIDREDVSVQFRAKWLDADVVVKLFIPGASVATFADEVTVWRQLRHPNVIKLYGACNVAHYFFVSEFASNGTLVEHLAACRRSGADYTPWKFLHEAALGLAYLHERKIVHGDLRGSNILIGSDGLAKLAEFSLSGSSSVSGSTGSATGVFGLTRWQSPERVKGEAASYASDVYSLGLCIVEALSWKIPWREQREGRVIDWKECWDPAADARSGNAPGPLTDDVVGMVTRMCTLDPAKRVAASVAAQMLERLATKELTDLQMVHQPKLESLVRIDEFNSGELIRLWTEMRSLMMQSVGNNFQRHAFDEVDAMYKQLELSTQPYKLLEQFYKVLVDVDSIVRPDSYQNRIQRLSATRATGYAMDGMRRRLDGIWSMINGSQSETEAHKQRWSDQKATQLELFVSEVEQTLLVLNQLDTEEDRMLLAAILRSEIDVRRSNCTPGQLSVIQKAYDDLVQNTTSNVLMTTPEWFLPWHELEVDNATCVGTGGFGGVYRARWLESEVVVKLLNQGGSVSTNDNSTFASYMSSTVPSRAATNPNHGEEQKKMREMFAREVGVWFGLSHPHIVRLFGACHIGTMFFACEYAMNGSLDKYLRKHPEELWQKMHEAALGVQYLHSRGIVHGDLKCNNILVGGDGKAKVTDFGLSSDAALLDQADAQVSGAWQWVAPECLEHGASHLSSASDIYALGMCVIEALRVVEVTTLKLDERVYLPLPWGDLDNAAVKYHVVRQKTLPRRPKLCSDNEWALVARMCVTDPSRRVKISSVVDELGKLANVELCEVKIESSTNDQATMCEPALTATSQLKDLDKDSPNIAAIPPLVNSAREELDAIAAVVAQMNACTGSTEDTSNKVVTQIFGLFWNRMARLSSVITNDGDYLERLRVLIERAKESTMVLSDTPATLIEFTQTAVRGYALHRDLDKLVESTFWRVDSAGGEIHDWRSRCNAFLGVADAADCLAP